MDGMRCILIIFFTNYRKGLDRIELDFGHAFPMDGNHKLTRRHLKIRKDLEIKELDRNMVYDRTLWRNLIHVADPA
jgi:hypothetical protein